MLPPTLVLARVAVPDDTHAHVQRIDAKRKKLLENRDMLTDLRVRAALCRLVCSKWLVRS